MESLTIIQALRTAFPEVSLAELKALTPRGAARAGRRAATELGFALKPAER